MPLKFIMEKHLCLPRRMIEIPYDNTYLYPPHILTMTSTLSLIQNKNKFNK